MSLTPFSLDGKKYDNSLGLNARWYTFGDSKASAFFRQTPIEETRGTGMITNNNEAGEELDHKMDIGEWGDSYLYTW